MNRGNQIAEFSTVLRTKMCVHVLTIVTLAVATVLACAGAAAGAGVGAAATTWYVDDDGGVDFTSIHVMDVVV